MSGIPAREVNWFDTPAQARVYLAYVFVAPAALVAGFVFALAMPEQEAITYACLIVCFVSTWWPGMLAAGEAGSLYSLTAARYQFWLTFGLGLRQARERLQRRPE